MAIGMKDNSDTEEINVVSDLNQVSESQNVKNKNVLIIAAVVAVIVIIIIAMIKTIMKPEEKIDMVDDGTGTTEQLQSSITSESVSEASTEANTQDDVNVGLPEFDPKSNGQTTAIVYSAGDYIKDLNGSAIPAVYNVATRTYVRDFANYEAKRAIIADGMEMYWLEILYKDKPYRCQVPYYVFKDLDTTGICVVEIELLTLEGGEQVISFMQVVPDYNDLIN